MSHSLKEEEAVQHIDLDQHDDARCNKIEKGHDIKNADDVEDHVPWTSQGLAQTGNHVEKRKREMYGREKWSRGG